MISVRHAFHFFDRRFCGHDLRPASFLRFFSLPDAFLVLLHGALPLPLLLFARLLLF